MAGPGKGGGCDKKKQTGYQEVIIFLTRILLSAMSTNETAMERLVQGEQSMPES